MKVVVGVGRARMRLSERDGDLRRWIGEQYTVRADLLAVLMAMQSDDPQARQRGRLASKVVRRRIQAWRKAGLVNSGIFLVGTPATV